MAEAPTTIADFCGFNLFLQASNYNCIFANLHKYSPYQIGNDNAIGKNDN